MTHFKIERVVVRLAHEISLDRTRRFPVPGGPPFTPPGPGATRATPPSPGKTSFIIPYRLEVYITDTQVHWN